MFVTNCAVNKEQAMAAGARPQGSEQRKRRYPGGGDGQQSADGAAGAGAVPQEVCYPVLCGVCGTHLGMQDADEIYHFVHVLASNP